MTIPALEFNLDGDFYLEKTCCRCSGTYYAYALQNAAWSNPKNLCDWCSGKCSASDQERRNESALAYVPMRHLTLRTCEAPRLCYADCGMWACTKPKGHAGGHSHR